MWDGKFDFATPPSVSEEILVSSIPDRFFRFKEQGFLRRSFGLISNDLFFSLRLDGV